MDPVESKATSLGERLLKARDEKQEQAGSFRGRIQFGDAQLIVAYRALGYGEERGIVRRHRNVPDGEERDMRLAADTLATASTGTTAQIEGESHDLPPLGLELAEALGLEGPENDVQAVMVVYREAYGDLWGRRMGEHFGALEQWASDVNLGVDDELTGE